MTAGRVRFYFTLAVLVLLPCFASAATSEFRVLFDVDHDPSTGCTVGTMNGVDQIFVIQTTNDDTTARVTRTHRLLCSNGTLGEPIDVDETGTTGTMSSETGTMTVETRVPFTAFQPAPGLPFNMHLGFIGSSGAASQSLLNTPTGAVLLYPSDAPGRRRAVDFGDPRVIVMDGLLEDWGNIPALGARVLGAGDTGFQFSHAWVWGNPVDQFLYFAIRARVATGSGPTANDDDYVRPQGQSLVIPVAKGVLKNDVDPNGEPLTATKVSEPNHGAVTLNPDGSFQYTPTAPSSVEEDHFTYTASNGSQSSNVAKVTIEVNDKPKVKNGTLTVAENVPNGTVVGVVDVTDQAGDSHTFSILSGNIGGAFAITPLPNGDGQLTVANRNAVNFEVNPVFTLTVKVTDEGGLSDTGIITVNVTNLNDAPVATNDSRSVAEDQILNVVAPGLFANASDEDGNALTLSIVANAVHGLVTLNPDGSWSYDSDPNYNGPDSFTWRAYDGTVFSNTATVNITVTPVNDTPSFTAGSNVNSPEDTAYSAAWATAISAGPADEAGQTLSFTVVAATPGLFLVQPAIDASGNLTFTPAANANGSSSVDVTLFDNGGGTNSSGTVSFTITITPVNDVPSFTKGLNQTVAEDAGLQTVGGWATAISAGPADEAGQTLTFNVVGNTNAGLFFLAPSVAANGTLTYTPAADANGTATISITLSDDGTPVATSAVQSFTITVTAVNDTPVNTVPGAQNTNEDTTLSFTTGGGNAIQIADVDAGAGSLQVTLDAMNGTLTADTGATITNNNTASVTLTGTLANINASLDGLIFTPTPDYFGAAQIDIITNDLGNTGSGGAQQDSDTITITVANVNDQPSVNAATFSLDENSANGTSVGTVTFSDPDSGDTHTFAISAGNTGGAFAINASTGEITVASVAALDYETNPTFSLTVDVTDDSGSGNATGSATITINLNNLNEAPVANDATFNVDENSANGTAIGAVVATDPDAGQTLSYAITGGNTGSAFQINSANGSITVLTTAALNFEVNPTFSLTVTVTDNGTGNLTDTATITVNLNNLNEAPVVNAATVSLNENSANGTSVHTVTFTEPDTTGQTHTFAITAGNTGGAFAINASTGEITVADTADVNFEVTPTFALTVEVTDAGAPTPALSGTATITINLTNVNDAPVVNDQSFNVDENSANGTVVGTVAASDEDAGQTLTYSITGGNALGAFAINPGTGQITVADVTDLNYEVNPTFSLTVQVMDNGAGNLTDTATITINLNNLNEAPSLVSALVPANVTENAANGTTVTTVTANDPDAGQTLSFAIIGGNTGGAFAINGSGQISVANSAAVDFETNPNFSLTVQVTDNGTPAASDTEVYLIDVNNINEAPVVNAATFGVNENSPNGTSVGTVTYTEPDGIGQTHSYAISAGNTGGAFAINASTGEITVANVAALDFETTPTFSLTVDVTDNGVPPLTGSNTITINLIDANEAPIVNDQSFNVDENSSIGAVVGSVAFSDPDGPSDTFSIISGNAGGEFALNPTTGQITVAAALNYEITTSYAFTVQISDAGTPLGTDTAVITININNLNETPVVTPATFNLNENSANATSVGTVSYTDPDAGQTHTYSITAGNTGGAFAINASTGEITVANSAAVNFETTPSFSLTVQVADNGAPVLNGTATITVNLNNVNDAPVVNDQSFSVNENVANGTVVGTVAASDEDAGQTLTYSITAGNTGTAFAINPANGQITVANPINYEAVSSYSLTVQVQDNGAGNLTDTATVTVTINNLNENPVVTPATFAIAENSANGTVVGTVAASDPDVGQTLTYAITAGNTGGAFAINSANGQITVANPINYEALSSYSLTVQVTDNGAPNLSGSATITINVTDANENPVVTPATFALDENSANTTVVGTVSATDPDAGQTLTYSITAGNTGGAFTINGSSGQITVANSLAVNFEVTPTFSLTVQAQDNGAGNLTGTATITINLNNVNDAPVIGNQSFNVNENSPNATVVGTVAATEEDAGQTLTYAITAGNTGSVFAINSSTGQITVVGALNYEGPDDPYLLTVQVTDNAAIPASSSATVTINVIDVNEAPILNDAARTINENSPNATLVGAVLPFTDEDAGQTYTFAITAGNTGGAFAINNAGQISVANVAQLNYEVVQSFSLTVQITDNGTPNLSDTATVTVSITDINEAPTAVTDTYNALGGTTLHIAGNVTVPATNVAKTGDIAASPRTTGVKANDTDPDTLNVSFSTLTVTGVTGNAGLVAVPLGSTATTTTTNGTVTIHSDGSFVYTPNVSTVADSFTYRINDGLNDVTGTVNVTLLGPAVRYVKNNAPTVGNGTSLTPHQTLAAAITASAAGEIIYVMEGDGTATNYDGSNIMKANQKLWGQGIDLDVGTTTNGQTVNDLITATNRPLIGPGAANEVVRVTNVTGVEVRGFSINGGTTNAADVTTTGASNASLTFIGNIVTSAGAEAIDLNNNGTGTITADIQSNTITSTGNGIDYARTSTGASSISLVGNTVTSTATGINIAGGAIGSSTITAFSNNTISGNTGGTGIAISNATFDATAGGTFQNVNAGTTTVGAPGNGVGASGILLTTVAGDLTFPTLSIYADSGTGLLASSGTAYTGSAGLQLVANTNNPVIQATNGPAVDLSTVTTNLQPTQITSTNSATTGVNLSSVAGTFIAGATSTITNISSGAGTAYRITGSSVNATYNGTITTSNGTGVSLTTNSGTYAFTGTLTLTTGANSAFVATSSGTVSSTDVNSTLSTTTATALNVSNTNIASAGLIFKSITAGTAASGPATGITLNNTGTTAGFGGLTIGGGASAGNGGTIQRAATGISLTNTRGVVLNDLLMSNFTDWAIRGSGVVNFTLDNTTINGTNGDNDATNDGSIYFTELTGSATISNSAVSGGYEDNIVVLNTTGTLDRITLNTVNIGANGTTFGDNGVLFEASGTATLKATVTGCTFTSTRGDHIQYNASTGSPNGDFVLTSNNFSNSHPSTVSGAGGIRLTTGGAGSSPNVTYNISNNTINGARGTAIGVTEGIGNGTLSGTLNNNNIGTAATANSGSLEGNGISIVLAELGSLTANITNNTVRQYNLNGIFVQAGGGASASSGDIKAVITGNTIGNYGNNVAVAPPAGRNGFQLNSGTFPGDTFRVCLDFGGAGALENSIVGSGDGVGSGTDFRLRHRQSTTVYLNGYAGANNDDAAVTTYIQNRNTGTPSGTVTNNLPNGGGWSTGYCPF
ncbi:MAG TPA: cadherin domain-containing protein [Thermoanaerobaculia bacterium]|nr:cadherin domain-containing protein [Thermoanaerobaculia bacterium]